MDTEKIDGQRVLDELSLSSDKVIVIHYAGEGWENKKGSLPRITSITVKNLKLGQLKTFSLYNETQLNKIFKNDLDEKQLDALEFKLLSKYFAFVKTHRNYKWLHWNMRFDVFGFAAIENRYKLLGGKPIVINDENKIDFPQILMKIYTEKFETEETYGKFINLARRNQLADQDVVHGKVEVQYFLTGEYFKIHISNIKKVDAISGLANLAISKRLKINEKYRNQHFNTNETTENKYNNKNLNKMEEIINTLFGWIPKSMRPILGIIAFGGIAFWAYNNYLKPKPDKKCVEVTIRGVIDTPKQNKIKSINIEKITFGEDKNIVNGKFEIEKLKFKETDELTLTVAFNDNTSDKVSISLSQYEPDANCIIDIGHQKVGK